MQEILGFGRQALERARTSRDPRFDGKFFIAVRSTGVYCRPVCPVPSPKKANVRYFMSAAAAAEAGFRPCLRCRPEAAPGTPAWLGTSAVVRRALGLIQDGALDGASVDTLAARVGIGSRHLRRLFMQHVGAAPITVAETRRLQFAKRLLDETELPIMEVALASGYGSLRRFNDVFRRTYGRAPRELRRKRRPGRAADEGEDVILRLAYRPPYDWAHVRAFLETRAVSGVERVDERGYARVVGVGDGHAVVCVRPVEGADALELRVRGAPPSAFFQLSCSARRMFDLAADPAAIALAFKRDPLLGPLVARRPGLRIPGAWDPFECAVRAVLGQQVSVAAGRTLAERLVARAGPLVEAARDGLTRSFPGPAALANADLQGIGLTGARIAALRALARAVLEGAVDFGASVEDAKAALRALPGFGPWTAEYVALRALGEPDAFPAADLVLRRRVAGGDGPPLGERALAARADAWRPWRGYAVLHLWGAAEAAGSFKAAKRRPVRRGSRPHRREGDTRTRCFPRPGARREAAGRPCPSPRSRPRP
jgi:AraC family transcriptional regulator of adaptative response / DNA-3-methyladenine glycosylase II